MIEEMLYGAVTPVLERAFRVVLNIGKRIALRELAELEDGAVSKTGTEGDKKSGGKARHSTSSGAAGPRPKDRCGSDAGPPPVHKDDPRYGYSISGRLRDI